MAGCKYTGQFGPDVIGQKEFDAEKKLTEDAKDIYGPAVTGKHPAEAVVVAEVVVEVGEVELPEHDSLSVAKVRAEVKGDVGPSTIDRLMRDEFLRPEGPRKSVLEILRSKEAGREEPRAEVIEALEAKAAEL